MKKLYEKDEVIFAVVMIAVYVAGGVLAQGASGMIGVGWSMTSVFNVILTIILLWWVMKNGLAMKYGLVRPAYPARKAWYFIPLVLVAGLVLMAGVQLRFTPLETGFYLVSMVCVGFLEELIFRGFLFRAMKKTNVTAAIIVSSLTFGIGHIVNLLNGAPLFETLMQIVFAIAVGFALVMVVYKGKSLLPCIVFHSTNNCLEAFQKPHDEIAQMLSMNAVTFDLILVSFFVTLLVVYSIVCLKNLAVA